MKPSSYTSIKSFFERTVEKFEKGVTKFDIYFIRFAVIDLLVARVDVADYDDDVTCKSGHVPIRS
jgi:hypothetical protein